jgi:hypothetical protein
VELPRYVFGGIFQVNFGVRRKAFWGVIVGTWVALATSGIGVAHAPSPDFSSRWGSTPLHRVQGPEGPVEARIYERFVDSFAGSFTVGSVSYFKFPKTSKNSPEQIAEQMRVAMGFEKWQTRRQRNAQVYEAIWDKMHQYVRVFTTSDAKSVTLSVALFRIAYTESVAVESEMLQRELTGSLEHRMPWLDQMVSWAESSAGIAKAYADGCPPCSASDPTTIASCTACEEGQLAQELKQATTAINGATSKIGDAIGTANKLGDQASKLADRVHEDWSTTNTEIHRTNDILQKLLTPAGEFLAGFTTAAGAAVGSMGVSLVVQAATTIAGKIYELITHKQEDRERLEAFEKAKQELEKMEPAMARLEGEIDSSLYIAEMAEGSGTREIMIRNISQTLRSAKIMSEFLAQKQRDALARHDMTPACLQELNAEGATLDEMVGNWDKLLKTVKANNKDDICGRMQSDIETLIKAESALQEARLNITSNQSAWEDAWNAAYQKDVHNADESVVRLKDNHNRSLSGAEKNWNTDVDKMSRDLRTEMAKPENKKLFDACMDRHHPVLRKIWIIGPLFTVDTRSQCRVEVMSQDTPQWNALRHHLTDVDEAHHNKIDRANRDYEAQSAMGPVVQANPVTNNNAHDEYLNWIQRLRGKNSVDQLQARNKALAIKRAKIAHVCSKNWDPSANREYIYPFVAPHVDVPLVNDDAPKGTSPAASGHK